MWALEVDGVSSKIKKDKRARKRKPCGQFIVGGMNIQSRREQWRAEPAPVTRARFLTGRLVLELANSAPL